MLSDYSFYNAGNDGVLLLGDNIEVLKFIADNSIDALLTDPPASISFMGMSWDSDKGGRDNWIDWLMGIMKECLRVLKPGAYGLVWALPRTAHLTTIALDKAGFEIRDVILHLYGSGFPKSHNIGKSTDKIRGNKREVVGKNPNDRDKRENNLSNYGLQGGVGKGNITKGASEWEGWGTALKPASEHWILVRKPLSEKTIAKNVLKWGVGGINIDDSRIEIKDKISYENNAKGRLERMKSCDQNVYSPIVNPPEIKTTQGRFPANLILECICEKPKVGQVKGSEASFKAEDYKENKTSTNFTRGDYQGRGTEGVVIHTNPECPCYILDKQSGILTSGKLLTHHKRKGKGLGDSQTFAMRDRTGEPCNFGGDSGGASRFFKQIRQEHSNPDCPVRLLDEQSGDIKSGRKVQCQTGHQGQPFNPRDHKFTPREYTNKGRFPANLILECICDKPKVGQVKSTSPGNRKGEVSKSSLSRGDIKLNASIEGISRIDYGDKNGNEEAVIHTNPECPCAMLDEQSGKLRDRGNISKEKTGGGMYGHTKFEREHPIKGDAGGASRFFYQAKASKSERNGGCDNLFWQDGKLITSELYLQLLDENEKGAKHNIQKGNTHPTVKPVKLMEYFINLISPDNAIVLDPFAGSGSTGVACINTDKNFILIEESEGSAIVSKARLAHSLKIREEQKDE